MSKEKFSIALRKVLKEHGETQKELAERVGAGRTTLRAWLDRNIFPRSKVEEIAEIYSLGSLDSIELMYDIKFARTHYSHYEQGENRLPPSTNSIGSVSDDYKTVMGDFIACCGLIWETRENYREKGKFLDDLVDLTDRLFEKHQ